MNETQIQKIVNKNLSLKSKFIGCFPIDRLPDIQKFPACFIVNFDTFYEKGSHWVAVDCVNKNVVEYFDSFGRPPKTEVLEKFKVVSFNKKVLQSMITDTCGHFCLFYLIKKCQGFSMYEIVSFLESQINADKYVANYINK